VGWVSFYDQTIDVSGSAASGSIPFVIEGLTGKRIVFEVSNPEALDTWKTAFNLSFSQELADFPARSRALESYSGRVLLNRKTLISPPFSPDPYEAKLLIPYWHQQLYIKIWQETTTSDHTHTGFLIENVNPQVLTYTISQSSVDSGAQDSYANLTDDSLTTGAGTANDSMAWIRADFGQNKTFNRISLAGGSIPRWDTNVALYLNGAVVEISIDGSLWMSFLPPITDVINTGNRWYAFTPITARYVRLRKSGYLGACEFKIYG
jgi:hypothetical protein